MKKTMTSISAHFGEGVDTSIFDLNFKDVHGKRRHCTGKEVRDSSIGWYSFANIPPQDLSFCEYCAKTAFDPIEIKQVTNHELIKTLVCDSYNKDLCIRYGVGDRRSVRKDGMKINVNIVDKDNHDFVPVLKLKEFELASQAGWLSANLPSGCYYEIVVMPDESWISDTDHCFLVEITNNGRTIRKEDDNGNTNYVRNMYSTNSYTGKKIPNLHIVNGYKVGEGGRFFFHAPSKKEKEHALSGDSKDSIFEITTTIFKRIWGCKKCNYKDSENNLENGLCHSCSHEPVRCRGVSKGGNTFRGTTKGASSKYKSGSSYAAKGYTSGAGSTKKLNARYEEIKKVKFSLQLINNESEAQLEYISKYMQSQVDTYARNKAKELREQAERIERGDVRSSMWNLSHEDMANKFSIE